jgi:lysophospholipase L1-like esterase
MIKPFQAFIFGLSVLLLLICISLFTPSGNWNLGLLTVKIPSFTISTKTNTPQYKDISKIKQLGASLDSISNKSLSADSAKADSTKNGNYAAINRDSLKNIDQPIEFPENKDTVLNVFFENLLKLKESHQTIHVLHYGDSQLEGDRITSYLRYQFQSRFGGSGIGLFPVIASNPNAIPYDYETTGNWERFGAFQNKARHNKYGALMSFSKYSAKKGLFSSNNLDELEASVTLLHPNSKTGISQRFTKCSIFFGGVTSPLEVNLKQADSILKTNTIQPSDQLNELSWNFEKIPKNICISFKGKTSPDIYALSLTSNQGVYFDNIAIRGSSGLEFSKSDAVLMQSFYAKLNTKLIILQFGVNVVPNVTSSYDYYEQNFSRQLEYLKRISGGCPIIVIGVSDVSQNTQNGFESYPNIEKIRDAQKKAAFKHNCAFWDMYKAMGGKNSMPSWVNANPPLAQKDYTHLNPSGARIIGEMFYRALAAELNRYSK